MGMVFRYPSAAIKRINQSLFNAEMWHVPGLVTEADFVQRKGLRRERFIRPARDPAGLIKHLRLLIRAWSVSAAGHAGVHTSKKIIIGLSQKLIADRPIRDNGCFPLLTLTGLSDEHGLRFGRVNLIGPHQ